MITRLTVRNFKAMRDMTVALGAIHVLECPNDAALCIWLEEYAARERLSVEEANERHREELLEFVCRKGRHRLPRPQDFDRVAGDASLADWRKSRSFRRVVDPLRQWFPKPPAA